MTTETKVQDTSMYRTRDFSQFKILNYNRAVDFKRITTLMDSINENGFLMPILVSENMEVVDGQHRLEAAKRLNCEVTYIKYNISDLEIPILISTLNSVSKNWKISDYYSLWSRRGVDVYLWMGDIVEKYNLEFNELYFLFVRGGSTGKNLLKNFKNGSLTFTESQKNRIISLCEKFNTFINYSELFKSFKPTFRNAVLEIVKNPDYDSDRMIRKLQQDAGRLLNCVNKIDFIFQLEKVYNTGERDRVDFIKTKSLGISAAAKTKMKKK